MIGSLTQKKDLSSSDFDVKGKFSLKAFGKIGKLFAVGASGELSAEHKGEIDSYELQIKLTADFFNKGDQAPSDVTSLLEIFKNSPSSIGEGVACEVELTPLTWYQTDLPTFRELADADSLELANLYDNIILLGQNRAALSADANEQKALFPSFVARCHKSGHRVSRLIQHARQELRSYLEAYRSEKTYVKATITFRDEVERRFEKERQEYEVHHNEWLGMMERVRTAKIHGYSPASINELRGMLTRQAKGTVVVIFVPEKVQFSKLLLTYRELAEEIRKWRATVIGGSSEENNTVHCSVYLDKQLEKDLLELDDESLSVNRALQIACSDMCPVFLTYGLVRETTVKAGWNVLNQEGWGVVINREEGWRYVGDVRNGTPHGTGVITYTDGSVYRGSWFSGKRDGSGELFPPQSQSVNGMPTGGAKGIFIDNICVRDGIIIKVTVYRSGSPVQSQHVALRKGDATIAHVDKIGRALDWQLGQLYRLRVESGSKAFSTIEILANGARIDPTEDPGVERMSWPLDAAGEKYVVVDAL